MLGSGRPTCGRCDACGCWPCPRKCRNASWMAAGTALRQKEQHLGFLARQQKVSATAAHFRLKRPARCSGDSGRRGGWLRNIARCRRDGSRRIRWHRHHGFFDGRFAAASPPISSSSRSGRQQRAEATAYERAAHLGAVGQRRNAEGQRDKRRPKQKLSVRSTPLPKTPGCSMKTGEGPADERP